jgi:hypothetical protein
MRSFLFGTKIEESTPHSKEKRNILQVISCGQVKLGFPFLISQNVNPPFIPLVALNRTKNSKSSSR